MPVYMVERRFAEQLEPTLADAAEVNRINADEDVRWLYSFLAAALCARGQKRVR